MQEVSLGKIENYVCSICGFVYDEESAERTPENTLIAFPDLDFEWTCPGCGVTPDFFVPADLDLRKPHTKRETY